MKYRVLELSYINEALVEPGAIVDIPENVLKPGSHGSNLEPFNEKKGAKDGEVQS